MRRDRDVEPLVLAGGLDHTQRPGSHRGWLVEEPRGVGLRGMIEGSGTTAVGGVREAGNAFA